MTLIELVIASAILMAVLAVVGTSVGSFQQAQEFARRRSQTLDELRVAAAAFSRDARQAHDAVITPPLSCGPSKWCGSKITFDTFVGGGQVPLVVWELKEFPAGSGNVRLVRTPPGGPSRMFGDDLMPAGSPSSSVFTYTEVTSTAAEGEKPTLSLRLNARPRPRDPVVGLTTKVALRNA